MGILENVIERIFPTADIMTAADIYDGLSFIDPDARFNKPAPEPWVAFMIGSVSCANDVVTYLYKSW